MVKSVNHGSLVVASVLLFVGVRPLQCQRPDSVVVSRNDSVSVRLLDVDIRAAVQALSPFLDRPIVFAELGGSRVSIETPSPIHVSQVPGLLRSILRSHNLELETDSGVFRVRASVPVAPPTAPATSTQSSQLELFAVRLSHARAADVAATLNALYGRASAPGELGAPPPTLGEQLRQSQVPAIAPPAAPQAAAGRAASLSGDVTIVPDPRANSLLIRANRADFELLRIAVQEIDVRPPQVLIEVLIAEVRRDRRLDFGLQAALPPRSVGSGNATVEATSSGGGIGDLVIRLMGLGAANVDALLRAAEARGDVSIVSRPVVLTANNKSAEIVVGSQRPFVQVSRALPTDSPLHDQVVQYRDVATRLHVLPTIGEDGYVMLEVTQEVNAATSETEFNAPVISTRSVQTNLIIRDGQTVALGGLTDRQKDVTQGGVPILSRTPIIGGLFGRSSRRTTETELFLFITPRVIRTDQEAIDATEPYLQRAKVKK